MTNRLVVYRRGHTPQSLHSHIYMFSECLLGCSQMWSHPSVDCISTADLFSAGLISVTHMIFAEKVGVVVGAYLTHNVVTLHTTCTMSK